jgi:hypothetical protein
VFPSAWKESVITPLLREEDYETPNDIRPVSLLRLKACEGVALNQLTEYLQEKSLLQFITVAIKSCIRQRRSIYL